MKLFVATKHTAKNIHAWNTTDVSFAYFIVIMLVLVPFIAPVAYNLS